MKIQILLVFLMVFLGVLHLNGQNVGIGTTNPQATLDVNGDLMVNGRIQTSSLSGLAIADSEGTEYLFLKKAQSGFVGKFGINTSDPRFQLHISRGQSNIFTDTEAGTGIAITGNFYKPRIYLEHLDAPDNRKILLQEFKDGVFSWHSMTNIADDFANPHLLVVDMNGRIGMGVATPNHPLQMASGAHCTDGGVWTNASDRRLKKNVTNLQYGLKDIVKLRPVQYAMIADGSEQVGFIAQDVQKVIPELVSGLEGEVEKGETLGLSYGNLTAVLVKAIQEQQLQIELLKAQNEALAKEKQQMANAINKLEAAVFGTASLGNQGK